MTAGAGAPAKIVTPTVEQIQADRITEVRIKLFENVGLMFVLDL